MGLQQKIYTFFNNTRMTDCTFIVGSDGSEEVRTPIFLIHPLKSYGMFHSIFQSVSAHAIVLAMSSPVFEYALQNNRNFRIKGLTAQEFRQILQ